MVRFAQANLERRGKLTMLDTDVQLMEASLKVVKRSGEMREGAEE